MRAVLDLYSFKGRLGRLDFALTGIALFTGTYFATFLLIVLSGAGDEPMAGVTGLSRGLVASLAAVLLCNAVIVALAAAVKRCHDRDRSGWMLLFVMPPLLGQLWLVLSLITGPGTPGPNRYGRRDGAADATARWAASLSPRAALA